MYLEKYEIPPRREPRKDLAEFAEFECPDYARMVSLHFFSPPDWCFYCGQPLSCENLVFWSGQGDGIRRQIWMHAQCAMDLADGLIPDAEKGGALHCKKVKRDG